MNIFFSIIIGIYIFFLPGFLLSFLFYKWRAIDLMERIILSFFLSLLGVTLIIAYTNFAGIPITSLTIMIQVTVLLFFIATIFFIQYIRASR